MSEPKLVVDNDERDDDGGAIGRALTKVFGRSYRTTIAGGLATLAASITAVGTVAPGLIPLPVVHLTTVLAPILLGGGLIVAKDGKVSGKP